MKEAYVFMPDVMEICAQNECSFEKACAGTKTDLAYAISWKIRGDYTSNGSLINSVLADGSLYRLMTAYLRLADGDE